MTEQTYDNKNSGALFKNDKKETDRHPDYKGSLDVGGIEFWISGWMKTSQAGKRYMSLAVKHKEPKGETRPIKQYDAGGDDMNDEMPF